MKFLSTLLMAISISNVSFAESYQCEAQEDEYQISKLSVTLDLKAMTAKGRIRGEVSPNKEREQTFSPRGSLRFLAGSMAVIDGYVHFTLHYPNKNQKHQAIVGVAMKTGKDALAQTQVIYQNNIYVSTLDCELKK